MRPYTRIRRRNTAKIYGVNTVDGRKYYGCQLEKFNLSLDGTGFLPVLYGYGVQP